MRRAVCLLTIAFFTCLTIGCNESASFAEIKLLSVQETGGEITLFRAPNEGSIYLIFLVEASNNTDDILYSSPAPQGEKYLSYILVDGEGTEYAPLGFHLVSGDALNYAEAYRAIRQDIYFEIPDDWESATFSVFQNIIRHDESKMIFTQEITKADLSQ